MKKRNFQTRCFYFGDRTSPHRLALCNIYKPLLSNSWWQKNLIFFLIFFCHSPPLLWYLYPNFLNDRIATKCRSTKIKKYEASKPVMCTLYRHKQCSLYGAKFEKNEKFWAKFFNLCTMLDFNDLKAN